VITSEGVVQIYEQKAVAFEVMDTASRLLQSTYVAQYPGIIRPVLDWTTDVRLPEDSAVLA
jgi:hypothetical protein